MKQDRMARVNRLIQAALADTIPLTIKDPRVARQEVLSIVAVRATKDLRFAKVYCSVAGSPDEQRAAVEGLQRARGLLRSELARQIRLRYTPELDFVLDETQKEAEHIEQILREIANEEKLGD